MRVNKNNKMLTEIIMVILVIAMTYYLFYLLLKGTYLVERLGWVPFKISLFVSVFAGIVGILLFRNNYYRHYKGKRYIEIEPKMVILQEGLSIFILTVSLSILLFSILFLEDGVLIYVLIKLLASLIVSVILLWRVLHLKLAFREYQRGNEKSLKQMIDH